MTLPCCARQPDAHAPDCLSGRVDDLDDALAHELLNQPRQASPDLILWACRVIRLKAQWDEVRSVTGEHVR